MAKQNLMLGSLVEIWTVQESRRNEIRGTDVTAYSSKVFDINEDGTVDIERPTQQGKPVFLSGDLRYSFIFIYNGNLKIAEGSVIKTVRKEGFSLVRIELITQLQKYQRRAFYRLPVNLPMEFQIIHLNPNYINDLEIDNGFLPDLDSDWNEATINDISGGGIRFVSETPVMDLPYIYLQFRMGESEDAPYIGLIAKILDRQPVPRSLKCVFRAQFFFLDAKMQETIIQFIFSEQRNIRKRQQGIK